MQAAKMTSKGQVTIPKKVRDSLGLKQGERLQFYEKKGVFYIKKGIKKSSLDKWVGSLKGMKTKKTDTIIEKLRGR